MFPNALGSELVAILATLDPTSQAVGTLSTGWIPAGNHQNLLAVIQTGVLGTGATVDAKLQQAMMRLALVLKTSLIRQSLRLSKQVVIISRFSSTSNLKSWTLPMVSALFACP